MSTNLCEIWAALAADPANPSAIEKARAELVAIMQHLEDCEACQQIDDGMANPQQVYDALSGGGVTLSKDERETIARMDQVVADDRKSIARAVEEVLLPSLPMDLAELRTVEERIDRVQLFRAIDAVNLLVFNYASREPRKRIVLSPEGLRLGKTVAAERKTMLAEIVRRARVGQDSAGPLFDWTIDVAKICRQLFSDLRVSKVEGDSLVLLLDPQGPGADLLERWRPDVIEPQRAPIETPVEIYMQLNEIYFVNEQQVAMLVAAKKGAIQLGRSGLGRKIEAQLKKSRYEAITVKKLLGQIRAGIGKIDPEQVIMGAFDAAAMKKQLYGRILKVGRAHAKSFKPVMTFAKDRLKQDYLGQTTTGSHKGMAFRSRKPPSVRGTV
ncbi:MAG: hypothetical protein A3J29_23820 [Acidobacteria bacterium RIFCSPLOWO2_12_FULL_67_14b]|nr:MAG: hypothetical protein A3J29_23820 [Acidobacteria bacterium RIFCSPLOWO2_12_FULL_67_14b]